MATPGRYKLFTPHGRVWIDVKPLQVRIKVIDAALAGDQRQIRRLLAEPVGRIGAAWRC